MDDSISRQAAIDALGEKPLAWTDGEYELALQQQWESDIDAIKAVPSAQPERKKGKWDFVGDQVFVCTECGACYSQSQFEYLRTRKSDPEFPYFCPNCGADMRGETDE